MVLCCEGVSDAHEIVNKKIVPIAAETGDHLYDALRKYVGDYSGIPEKVWNKINYDDKIIFYLTHPEKYLGDAIEIAKRESENKL